VQIREPAISLWGGLLEDAQRSFSTKVFSYVPSFWACLGPARIDKLR
jgi:hypothetical protein